MPVCECPYGLHTHAGANAAALTAAINACPNKVNLMGTITQRGFSTAEATQIAADCATFGALYGLARIHGWLAQAHAGHG